MYSNDKILNCILAQRETAPKVQKEVKYMKAYETVFVLDPGMEKEAIDAEITKVKNIIEKAGEVEAVDEWGRRKLAYTIDKKYTEGYYVLITFKAEKSVINDLNHLYLITDCYIRDMIVARDEVENKPVQETEEAAEA